MVLKREHDGGGEENSKIKMRAYLLYHICEQQMSTPGLDKRVRKRRTENKNSYFFGRYLKRAFKCKSIQSSWPTTFNFNLVQLVMLDFKVLELIMQYEKSEKKTPLY